MRKDYIQSVWFSLCLKHSLFEIFYYSFSEILNVHMQSYNQVRSLDLSLVMRKTFFCICENKDADQFRGNPEADQRFGFRYTESKIPLFPKSSVAVQPCLCRTWSETPKTGFLTMRLICLNPKCM